jgi:hypothetical protein
LMRFTARLLLALALLLAQQIALAHQAWHAGNDDSQPARNPLCEQHAALATVAGALDCAQAIAPAVACADILPMVVAPSGAMAPRLAPTSRSPPPLLR